MNGYQIVNEALIKHQENPVIKKLRLSKSFIYLFHGTKTKFLDNILKNGINPNRMGTHWDGSSLNDISKITGLKKPVVYLTSNIHYALFGTGSFFKKLENVLCCKLYSKYLFHSNTLQTKEGFWDEYLYIKIIPPKDIIQVSNPQFNEIFQKYSYLIIN